MIRGLISRTRSYPKPSRSITPGAKFSAKTSAFSISPRRMARPLSVFRLAVTLFLLALSSMKYCESTPFLSVEAPRPCSPRVGSSTLITSAPSQARVRVHDVPASNWVRSTTRTPCKAPSCTFGERPLVSGVGSFGIRFLLLVSRSRGARTHLTLSPSDNDDHTGRCAEYPACGATLGPGAGKGGRFWRRSNAFAPPLSARLAGARVGGPRQPIRELEKRTDWRAECGNRVGRVPPPPKYPGAGGGPASNRQFRRARRRRVAVDLQPGDAQPGDAMRVDRLLPGVEFLGGQLVAAARLIQAEHTAAHGIDDHRLAPAHPSLGVGRRQHRLRCIVVLGHSPTLCGGRLKNP